VLVDEEKALNSYPARRQQTICRRATRIAWHLKKDEIKDDLPGITKRKFLYNFESVRIFEKEWGKDYKRPSPGERFFGIPLFACSRNGGPLKVFAVPELRRPETEAIF